MHHTEIFNKYLIYLKSKNSGRTIFIILDIPLAISISCPTILDYSFHLWYYFRKCPVLEIYPISTPSLLYRYLEELGILILGREDIFYSGCAFTLHFLP